MKTRLNLEKARPPAQLVRVSEPRLQRTRRSPRQMLKALRGPVVKAVVVVHIKSDVVVVSGRIIFKICIIIFSMYFYKSFVDLNTFRVNMTMKTHSWVSS